MGDFRCSFGWIFNLADAAGQEKRHDRFIRFSSWRYRRDHLHVRQNGWKIKEASGFDQMLLLAPIFQEFIYSAASATGTAATPATASLIFFSSSSIISGLSRIRFFTASRPCPKRVSP